MFKIGRNSPCPCGSGWKYKHCCLGKDFIFTEETDSSYEMQIPVTPAMKEVIERNAEEFRRHFEREPGDDAPPLLAKYLCSEQDIERKTVEAMTKTGVDPAVIYAYKKTGYIQLESQLNRYTGAAIAEWDEAIAEYDANNGEPDIGPEATLFDSTLAGLKDEFESLIYALGLANDNFFNLFEHQELESSEAMLSAKHYQFLCACRVHRTLRTIIVLEQERLSEDMIKLARSIYESYLHILAVQQIPTALDTLVNTVVGLRRGTHVHKRRKDGAIDKRLITELSSGREIPSQISAYKMAESSPFSEDIPFFDFFYTTTSRLIHPSVFALDGYVTNHGFDPLKPHMHEEAIVFIACVSAMVVDWIPRMDSCPEQVAKDCKTVVARTRKKLLTLLEIQDAWAKRFGAEKREFAIIKARCLRLGEVPATQTSEI